MMDTARAQCAAPVSFAFFHPDFTVDPGISPGHALIEALVGYHHRSGIGIVIPHPAPKAKYSIKVEYSSR